MSEKPEPGINQLREDERASGTTLEALDVSPPAEIEKTRTQEPPAAGDPNAVPEENAVTQTVTSQSQKLTKSKTIIIMGALCVCISVSTNFRTGQLTRVNRCRYF
jgi:hypothetical protein